MQDINLVPISEAAKWFPNRGGRCLSVKAIRRRIREGVNGVRLEARRDGREWFTSREWVDSFLAEVTSAWLSPDRVPVPSPASVERDRKREDDMAWSILSRRFGIEAKT